MKVLEFLRNEPNALEKLQKPPYSLNVKEDGDLVLLKYNQIESNMAEKIVQECRGIILDRDLDWKPVCVPFAKFFNWGESNAHEVNLSQAKIQEKCDGSIIKMFFHKGSWRFATNDTINAKNANAKSNENISFQDMIYDVVSSDYWDNEIFPYLNRDATYMFELIHPLNRIVVNYGEDKALRWIGYRLNNAGYFAGDYIEYDITSEHLTPKDIYRMGYNALLKHPNISLPKVYDVNDMSYEALVKLADNINISGADAKGFIVFDTIENYPMIINNRVKVKSPKYLSLHHLAKEII